MTDIERILNAAGTSVAKLTQGAFAELLERIRRGEEAGAAIQAIMQGFDPAYREVLAASFTETLGRFVGSDELRNYPIGEVTLSQRLYQHAAETSTVVRRIVQEHTAGWHDARKLALDIYEGYGFKQGNDPLQWPPGTPKWPKYMRAAVNTDPASFDGWLRVAQRMGGNLKTPQLKAAYLQALEAVEKGAGSNRLTRVLDVAYQERMRYFANRIAQTELARAHIDQRAAEIMADPEISVVRWSMSQTHPKLDICDLFAKQDKFRLGPGCYPKGKAPKPPAHPFCRCMLQPVITKDAADAKENPASEREFLRKMMKQDGISEAAKVIGSREKLAQVVNGKASVTELLNQGRPEAYRLGRANAPDRMGGMTPTQPPPPTRPTFSDQKTAKAAAEWAVKNNLADFADYSGVKPEVANAFNRSLINHLQEFPELRKDMKFMGTCQAQFARWREIEMQRYIDKLRAANPKLPPDFDFRPHAERYVKAMSVPSKTWAHAWDQPDVMGIGVNKKWGSDLAAFEKSISSAEVSGWHPVGSNSIKSVADHEFGHMLDYHLNLRVDKDVIQAYTEATAKGMKGEVSEYAAKNIQEFIAECWSESVNNPAPRPFAQRVAGIVRARYQAKHP